MILNADDFGLNARINTAIAEAFSQGLCSSATIMANGEGFEQACAMVKAMRLEGRVGIHLVLTNGMALCTKIRDCQKFCDHEGRLKAKRNWRLHFLTRFEREAVTEEFRAQIQRCRASGISPTHADTHHHIAEFWGVAQALLVAVSQEGIPWVRIARNVGPRRGVVKRVYRGFLNSHMRAGGVARTRWFGSVIDYLSARILRASCRDPFAHEVMLHPSLDQAGELKDALLEQPLAPLVRALTRVYPGPLVSFAGKGI